jgi:leader peptidase (prepilin peptidase) / N-methyltransferase
MPGNVFLSAIAFVSGLLVGSFLNVVIHRIPRGESVVVGRSKCPTCGGMIAWYDNVPLLSYAALGGKCRKCRAPISPRYPAVEFVSGITAALAVWFLGVGVEALTAFVFFALLLAITIIDWKHRIIPDSLSLGGTVAGLAFALARDMTFVDSLAGALAGGGVLFAVAAGYRLVRKAEGMGGGDVKLMGMIGAFLGWRMVLPVLILASFGGALYGLYLMRRGASARSAIAFGSFLAPAAAIAYVFGHDLWRAYVGLFLNRP